jgi:HEAT repeat protein
MTTAFLLAGLLTLAPADVSLEWAKDHLSAIHVGADTLAVTGDGLPMAARGTPNDWNGPKTTAVDAATNSVTRTYAWGTFKLTLTPGAGRLDLLTEISNTTAVPTDGMYCSLLHLTLPGGGSRPPVHWRDGLVALVNGEELNSPLVTAELHKTRARPDEFEVLLHLDPARHPHHAVVADRFFDVPGRPIAPGQSDRYRLSLRFGPPDATDEQLLADVYAERRRVRPDVLDWPDRRPMGTIFLCNSNLHWPKNPRGWLCGKGQGNDVTTEAGLVEFGRGLLEYADRSVGILKANNAQGVIVWDVEGAEWWHPITYVGNPQLIAQVAPEMDRFSDAFCRRFTDAGLKLGVTIRPTEVFYDAKHVLTHRDVADPVELMATKIAYAKKRWGATLFYLDSDVFTGPGIPWVMPAAMLETLHQRFPDVLIIPEWAQLDHYRFAAPYKSCNLGAIRTEPYAQAIYPEAFSVVAPNEDLLENHWDEYLLGRLSGDVLLFPAWYAASENRLVALVYREAEWRRHGPGAYLFDLAAACKSPDPEHRYHAAFALGVQATPEAQAALAGLLGDDDPLVRRAALLALGRQKTLADPALPDRLLAMMADAKTEPFLKPLLAKAVAPAGAAAVPKLTALLDSKSDDARRGAMDALALIKIATPETVTKLVAFVASKDKREVLKALYTLGEIGAKSAFDTVLAQLANPDEDIAQQAARALGKLGDLRAVEPLIKAFGRNWHTVVVYSIRDDLHRALQALTGAILDEDNGEAATGRWRDWLKTHRDKLP